MTREEKLKTVRDACIAANPSIAELGFGCRVKQGNREGYVYSMIRNGDRVLSLNFITALPDRLYPIFVDVEKGDKYEIIGRPIRLADVLLAISKNIVVYGGSLYELLWQSFEDGETVMHLIDLNTTWNLLKDDLEEQSDETLSFLAGLLGKGSEV